MSIIKHIESEIDHVKTNWGGNLKRFHKYHGKPYDIKLNSDLCRETDYVKVYVIEHRETLDKFAPFKSVIIDNEIIYSK